MSDEQAVLTDRRERVLVITINRPDQRNAINAAVAHGIAAALDELDGDSELTLGVLTGAGRGFCAGADMQELQSLGEDGVSEDQRNGARTAQTYPLTVPKPIVAAINGPCAGIGLVQALMCDIRFVAEDAKITTAFARRGLVAEHGISWILPRLVGPAQALDLLLSGRVVLGQEAAAMGLANRATPKETVLEETLAYAHELATLCSPASMATMKRQVYAALEQALPVALAEADEAMLESFMQPDFVEGVSSFVERRAPEFAPLRV
jgi:enoyl-CoA hydratase/carnithine racemase